jgi:hypothetical protein
MQDGKMLPRIQEHRPDNLTQDILCHAGDSRVIQQMTGSICRVGEERFLSAFSDSANGTGNCRRK